jgi:hypothetical protein
MFASMEERVARLEAGVEPIGRDLGEIKNDARLTRQEIGVLRDRVDLLRDRLEADFRITWVGIIASNLGLAGLMAKGFGWL